MVVYASSAIMKFDCDETMSNNWLEIPNPDIDRDGLARQVEAGLHQRTTSSNGPKPPEAIAASLWQQMIGYERIDTEALAQTKLQLRDCDIVPRHYTIGWQNPILGPIYAFIRNIINGEIRRFLSPSLERQSALNRQMLRMINDLRTENERLQQEIVDLKREVQERRGV